MMPVQNPPTAVWPYENDKSLLSPEEIRHRMVPTFPAGTVLRIVGNPQFIPDGARFITPNIHRLDDGVLIRKHEMQDSVSPDLHSEYRTRVEVLDGPLAGVVVAIPNHYLSNKVIDAMIAL